MNGSVESVRYLEGELHISLEVVAEIYRIQVVWLREVYDRGLLGHGVAADSTVFLQATRLDRIAAVVRLSHLIGPDVEELSQELNLRL